MWPCVSGCTVWDGQSFTGQHDRSHVDAVSRCDPDLSGPSPAAAVAVAGSGTAPHAGTVTYRNVWSPVRNGLCHSADWPVVHRQRDIAPFFRHTISTAGELNGTCMCVCTHVQSCAPMHISTHTCTVTRARTIPHSSAHVKSYTVSLRHCRHACWRTHGIRTQSVHTYLHTCA